MEYRELAMFLISEFLLAIGVPTTRVPFLMTGSGGAANSGNLAGDSEQSYQRKSIHVDYDGKNYSISECSIKLDSHSNSDEITCKMKYEKRKLLR